MGVDRVAQPEYAGDEFVQGDALAFIERYGGDFDFIHASPPCQRYSMMTHIAGDRDNHPDLIPPTRTLLRRIGRPWQIENVAGSSVRADVLLCGASFGLRVLRHRYFELGRWHCRAPVHHPHRGRVAGHRHGQLFNGPYLPVYGDGGSKGSTAQWREALGIDWTWSRHSLAEAIPPAYTAWLFGQFIGADPLVRFPVQRVPSG